MKHNYNKTNKLLSGVKRGLFALALAVFSGTAYAQTTYTFNYTGSTQTMALQAGTYTIQMWGADGGDNLGNGSTTFLQTGGKGGYSIGVYTLASAATIYINVGGKGSNSTSALNTTVSGGYNGGGYGSSNTTSGKVSGAGGGGASHVATAAGLLSSLSTNQSAVRIVAGGGGGAGESNYANNNTLYNSNGGNGGGASGLQNISTGYQGRHGQGGTQTAGGGGGDNNTAIAGPPLQGIFGAGGYNPVAGANTSPGGAGIGGGGGGWYGGGAGWGGAATSYCAGSGGGGSGYIGGVTNGTTAVFGQTGFVTNPDVTGNGRVLITELCSISLSATGLGAGNSLCSGNSVTLTTDAVSNYSWSTGATTQSIVVSPTSSGIYSLTATSVSACIAAASISITVNAAVPSLTVVNSATNAAGVCPNRTATLTASGATTYTWTGANAVTNGVSFTPSTASDYTVYGANACGTSSAVTSISIHPLPTVGAVASTASLCSGSTATVTATGNANSYAWTTAVVNVPVSNATSFMPTVTNTYIVTGTSVHGCTASAQTSIVVVTTPTLAPVANPASICFGQSTTLSAVGASSYTWTDASGVISSASFVIVSPTNTTAPTSYTVTKSNSNCVDTKVISVTTNSLPGLFAIVTPTIVCASTQATLFVGGAQNYTWTSPGPPSFSFTGSSPVVNPPVNTTYTVLGSNGTCANTTTVFLATNPNPTITVSATSSVICMGQSVTLNAFGATGANNYTWTSTSGTVPGVSSLIVSPTAPILYSVIGDNNFGCTSSASQILLVNQLPNVTAGVVSNKTLVCIAGPATLTAGGAHTYQWDPAAGGVTTATALVNPLVTTIYTVVGTNTITTCSNAKTVTVSVHAPSLSVSGPSNTCQGGVITLVASGGNNGSYNWNTGSGFNHQFPSVVVTVTAPSVYTVAANSTSAGVTCPASQTWSVGIFYNPTVTAVSERTAICKNESVRLFGSGAENYSWDNGSMNGDTVMVSPPFTATYVVIGTDVNGCADTNVVVVKVIPCTGLDELTGSARLSVYPNPSNGEFTIESPVDLTLKVINELGQEIRTIKLSQNNQHKISVTDLAKGIYFIVGDDAELNVKQKIIIE